MKGKRGKLFAVDSADLYLIQLLKIFLQSKTALPELPLSEDLWPMLFQKAAVHSVSGILGYMLMHNAHTVPKAVYEQARHECHKTMSVFMQRAQRMEALSRKLCEEGIDHLLFKGFVVRELYPVPELRSFGDIDFLIRLKDRERCHALMLRENYAVKDDWEPVYSYSRGIEYYEIHTDVMEVDVSDKADYKGYFHAVWDHTVQQNTFRYVMDPSFHLLYLLTHIAKHISGSGAGIRMYLDIALYVRAYRDIIDWDAFSLELQKLSFQDFANTVFTVTERCFGIESPLPLRPISTDVFDDFMDYTMEAGVFGHYGRDPGLVTLKKMDRNEETVSRKSALIERLFPTASSIESRYTYLQGKHWLLPVAWVHRLLRTGKWKEHAAEAQGILNMDEQSVLKMKRIYKEIGL